MKILLMTPINRSYVNMPSLGLGYIAAVLKKAGYDVTVLHSLQKNLDFRTFADFIHQNIFDVIGIQMFTYDYLSVGKHLDIIKAIRPQTNTILGGYHPSGDPYGVLESFPQADYALASEVELAFPRLMAELQKANPDLASVPNLIYRDDGKIKANPVKVVEDLDSIPFPAWDLMDPRTFPPAPHGGFFKSFPTAPIIITRGCPMRCTFCAGRSITTSRIRKRSIANVMEEAKFVRKHYEVNDLLIEDENFTFHKKLLREFCESLLKENSIFHWSCPSGVRLDTLDLEMLKLMERSGCYSLSVGIEFGSQRIHDITNKKLKLEVIREKLNLFREVNIKTTGFFLFGIPGETKLEMLKTIEFAKELPLDRAQFNNFAPLPGSKIYAEIMKDGGNLIDFDHSFVHDVGYIPAGMTRREMKNLQRRAYLSFYLRPQVMLGLIRDVATFKQFLQLMSRFVDAMK
jgi:anaerobic magnesium-protoporphyrin IX monomethyl ester cyclase